MTLLNKFRVHLMIVGIGFLVVGSSLYLFSPKEEEYVKEPNRVIVTSATSKALQNVLEHVGVARASKEVAVSSKTGGRVSQIFFKEGDIVKKGQVLLRVEEEYQSSEVLVNLQNARSNVSDAELSLDRTRLEREALTSQREIELRTKESEFFKVKEENTQKLLNEKREVITAMENLLFTSEQIVTLVDTYVGISDEELGSFNSTSRLALGAMDRTAIDDLRKQFLKTRSLLDRATREVALLRPEGSSDFSDTVSLVISVARSSEQNLYLADRILKATPVNGPFRTIEDLNETKRIIDTNQNSLNTAILTLQKEHNQVLSTISENTTSITRADNAVSNARKTLDSTRSQNDVAIQQAENLITQRKNDLNVAQVGVYNRDLRAPISGVVVDSDVEIGEIITAGSQFSTGTSIAVIVDVREIELDVYVSELDLPLIEMGQEVEVRVDAYPENIFTGTVVFISDRAEEDVRTFRVQVRLDNSDKLIKSGMTARAFLATQEKDVVTVPLEAVVSKLKNNVIYVVNDQDLVEERVVALGMIQNGDTEIIEGIASGEIIVLSGQGSLKDGDPVIVSEEIKP